jgi:NAD(P)-dependent dehydrogenase (short-subunit alcohol dehydrogenase family)
LTANIPRVALVTGAAKRLGLAMAKDLAKDGFAVAIHANTSLDEAEEAAAALVADGHRAIAVKADLSDAEETETLVDAVKARLGPVGVLVNNASVFVHDSVKEMNAKAWDLHFALHVRVPSQLAAALARQLPADAEGLVVNMVDQRVLALNPRFYSYTLSKSALYTATKTMAQALAPRIRVNAIGPGPTLPNTRQEQEDFDKQVAAVLLQRGPELDEFGRTIKFLIDTPSITGQMIALDGGQHLAWQTPDIMEIRE